MKSFFLPLLLWMACSFSFAQDAQTRREFLQTRAEMVSEIKEKDNVVETRERQLRKLLVTKSLAGEAYGKKGRIYYLTEGGHFAHPSILTVQLLEKDDGFIVQRTGSTGTSRILFDKWLSQMRRRDTDDMNEILGIVALPVAPEGLSETGK
jgi:hypothetical protein